MKKFFLFLLPCLILTSCSDTTTERDKSQSYQEETEPTISEDTSPTTPEEHTIYPVASVLKKIFTNYNMFLYGKVSDTPVQLEIKRINSNTRYFQGKKVNSISNVLVFTNTTNGKNTKIGSNDLFIENPFQIIAILHDDGTKTIVTQQGNLPDVASLGESGLFYEGNTYEDSSETTILSFDTYSWSLHKINHNTAELCINAKLKYVSKYPEENIDACHKITPNGELLGMKIKMNDGQYDVTLKSKGYDKQEIQQSKTNKNTESHNTKQTKLNGLTVIKKSNKVMDSFNVDTDVDANGFSEGLALVEKDDKYGFINKDNEVVIPLIYDQALWFSEGLAVVKKNGKYGFINKQGEEVIPLQYTIADNFGQGLALTYKDGKFNLINKQDEIVIPLEQYSAVTMFHEGLASVSIGSMMTGNKKCGFINKQADEVIPLEYEFCMQFNNGLARVNKNDKWFYINKQNECVKECR